VSQNRGPVHAQHVHEAERLHGDDTTVPVLAKGRTITGRLWAYVRDDRPFAGPAPPAVLFYYSRDRRGIHPEAHLAGYSGILQADAYSGFAGLYAPTRPDGAITEALCWAHARRHFYELADLARAGKAPPAPLALEAVRQIDAIFARERMINGQSAELRLAYRRDQVAPLVVAFETWMRHERPKLSRHAPAARAMDYLLKRWPAFAHFVDDGRICPSNNAAERASAARRGLGAKIVAVLWLGSGWPPSSRHVHPDRHREAQRRRPPGLARRRPRADRRPAGPPAARAAALELAALHHRALSLTPASAAHALA
jgi:hypothetical protein